MSKVNLELLGRYRKIKEVKDPDNLLDKGYFHNNIININDLKETNNITLIVNALSSSYRSVCFNCNTIGTIASDYYILDELRCPNCNNKSSRIYSRPNFLTKDVIRIDSEVKDNIEYITVYGLYSEIDDKEISLTLREGVLYQGQVNLDNFEITHYKDKSGEEYDNFNSIFKGLTIFKLKLGEKIKPIYKKLEKRYSKEFIWSRKRNPSLKYLTLNMIDILKYNIDIDKLITFSGKFVYIFLTDDFFNFKNFKSFDSLLNKYNIDKKYKDVIIAIIVSNQSNNFYSDFFNFWEKSPKDYKELLNYYIQFDKFSFMEFERMELIYFETDLRYIFKTLYKMNDLTEKQKKVIINDIYKEISIGNTSPSRYVLSKISQLINSKIAINNYTLSDIGYSLTITATNKYLKRKHLFLDLLDKGMDPIEAFEFLSKDSESELSIEEYEKFILNN